MTNESLYTQAGLALEEAQSILRTAESRDRRAERRERRLTSLVIGNIALTLIAIGILMVKL